MQCSELMHVWKQQQQQFNETKEKIEFSFWYASMRTPVCSVCSCFLIFFFFYTHKCQYWLENDFDAFDD